ncbi:NADPH:quinone oxidoreductase family protein [Nonomuraea sp. K274]|uniref:NADPH:quinone oxidoreductase family protein n=1 Tax=Nonomuraea cypriaca TaxID=1187855 RepID=A0A931AAP0_9ACTN|nr:NADPH:quinone oxidoreductase family protein [Nonomuraea cypriaca]MBF8185867.1 NADPH:quinone oxidoreductase family protein [Nonomuraea cypriaca]
MRAIQFARYGGPEVLEAAEVPDPVVGPGQVLIDVEAAGVNFADIRQIAGDYEQPGGLPYIPGGEVIGRTPDGRRVMGFTANGYASKAVLDAGDLVSVPDRLGPGEALALLVQGLTAWHLLRSSARLRPGESVVVNAGAGGVGSLAVQLAREFGAGRVIATASTRDKRSLAVELGADTAVDGAADGYTERIIEANEDRPVDVVLDAVGGAVFEAALSALAGFGRLVTYGSSSGEPTPAVDPGRLMAANLGVSGFWLRPVLTERGAAGLEMDELLGLVASGRVRPLAGAEYPLSEAGRALADLAGRRTVGKVVLKV